MNRTSAMPPAAWIAIGAGIGTAIGAALDNVAIGIAIGAALGVVVMALLSQNDDPDDNAKRQ